MLDLLDDDKIDVVAWINNRFKLFIWDNNFIT